MKELLVEKSKIKNNLKIINNIINKNGKNDNGEKVKLIAVVKGNGYGLDLVQYFSSSRLLIAHLFFEFRL